LNLAKQCDLFIEPEELGNYRLMDLASGREMFDIGYKYARKMLDEGRGSKI
jgi:hypothetical protein